MPAVLIVFDIDQRDVAEFVWVNISRDELVSFGKRLASYVSTIADKRKEAKELNVGRVVKAVVEAIDEKLKKLGYERTTASQEELLEFMGYYRARTTYELMKERGFL